MFGNLKTDAGAIDGIKASSDLFVPKAADALEGTKESTCEHYNGFLKHPKADAKRYNSEMRKYGTFVEAYNELILKIPLKHKVIPETLAKQLNACKKIADD
ncbi:hypothetical protein PG987_011772 [Apiospora arundinis]